VGALLVIVVGWNMSVAVAVPMSMVMGVLWVIVVCMSLGICRVGGGGVLDGDLLGGGFGFYAVGGCPGDCVLA